MDINATILGQAISFSIFVWFTMKFVWPVIKSAIDERDLEISKGLQNAEEAKVSLKNAESEAQKLMIEVKQQASELVQQANKRATQMVEAARADAVAAAEREKQRAAEEIQRQVEAAKAQLRKEVATLAVLGAEQILRDTIDQKAHSKLLDQLSAQL